MNNNLICILAKKKKPENLKKKMDENEKMTIILIEDVSIKYTYVSNFSEIFYKRLLFYLFIVYTG